MSTVVDIQKVPLAVLPGLHAIDVGRWGISLQCVLTVPKDLPLEGNPTFRVPEPKVEVNQKPLKFELDTGAAVSVISDITFKAVFPDLTLSPSNVRLRTYTDEAV